MYGAWNRGSQDESDRETKLSAGEERTEDLQSHSVGKAFVVLGKVDAPTQVHIVATSAAHVQHHQ